MLIKKPILLLLIMMHSATLCKKSIVFLIHGTWAHKKFEEHWYNPQGYFFETLEKQLAKENALLVPFLWSGGLSEQARLSAAQVLAKLIESYPEDIPINIIAHSHGATVAVLASQILGNNPKNMHRICQFYSLGRPVDNKLHWPDMNVIDYFYNFFSFNDLIQRVLGDYDREVLPAHGRIANIRIIINGQNPSHSELHHKCIAQWIYSIHDMLCPQDWFDFCSPGVLSFSDLQPPTYSLDRERETLRERDRRMDNALLHAIRMSKYIISHQAAKKWLQRKKST
jgi:hypothetical protein